MKIEHFQEYSFCLQRDMEYKVYGHSGKPCIVFPAQDGRYFDFENFKMIESCQKFIDQGLIQFFCVDIIDLESWSNQEKKPRERIEQHECWYDYICDEFTPRVKQISADCNDHAELGILLTGCSMGAAHSLNFFLRRPDLFDSVIALSGVYHARQFFKNYSDDLVYANSPIQYIENMHYDHFYVDLYRQRKIILCVGQGAWEDEMIKDTKKMEELFRYKDIPACVDYWGLDVNHDWPWWRKQLPYYLTKII
jgi:esterase/lipase superfamily enzyme